MLSTATAVQDQSIKKNISFLENLLGKYGLVDFAVRLWDGTIWNSSRAGRPRCTLVLNHPGALKRAFRLGNRFSLGEAYLKRDIDIEGDMEGAIALEDCLHGLEWRWRDRVRFRRLPSGTAANAAPPEAREDLDLREILSGAAKDFRSPLEPPLSGVFFRFFREAGLSPDCGYFQDIKDTLEAAQSRMYDISCGKLRLQEDVTLLDMNCGWGNLVFHAARNFGANVVGMGTDPQAMEMTAKAIHRAGLSYRCRLQSTPGDAPQEQGSWDRLIHVNLFDWVEESRLPDLFARAWNLLKPGGLFLFQGVVGGIGGPSQDNPGSLERLFPSEIQQTSIADILRIAEWTGFELREVENLREHCALSMRRWQVLLGESSARIRLLTNDTVYRSWRLFLATAGYGFQSGRLNFHQAILYKPNGGESGFPLPRP